MITHTIDSYSIPSQSKAKSKLEILRICQNVNYFNFENNFKFSTSAEVAS